MVFLGRIPQILWLGLWIWACFLPGAALLADVTEDLLQDAFSEGVTVDLREPTFENGVLTTSKGGVVTGSNIRIQAKHITYTRKTVDGVALFRIEAHGDVMLEYAEFIFLGSDLEYDFTTKTGYVLNAKSAVEPWYFGARRINLLANDSYEIIDGYLTTSETEVVDWRISMHHGLLYDREYLKARHVMLYLFNTPIFWVPYFGANLKDVIDAPFRLTAGWGGVQGPRLGVIYDLYASDFFKTFLRVDYHLKRGIGGGIETKYNNPQRFEELSTINYLAQDNSIEEPNQKTRFRFAGSYTKLIPSKLIDIDLTYDKLSDKEMPTDYADKGLDFQTEEKTQLNINYQHKYCSTNFRTRIRVNQFETVKQELPSLSLNLRPLLLGRTGIIIENQNKFSYLDYKYNNEIPHSVEFRSARYAWHNRVYRPFFIGPVVATPEAGGEFIYYGSSPEKAEKILSLATMGCSLNTRLERAYGRYMHVCVPYADYRYYTFPTIAPGQHYIFDLQDGWYRLNSLCYGFKSLLYPMGSFHTSVSADIYTYTFFDTPSLPQSTPKVYGRVVWNPTRTLRYTVVSAWDFEHQNFDHLNVRADVTFSEDAALSAEWRHRSAFSWRKVDTTSFILESIRTENELRHSPLSDRRNTFLLHFFYRVHFNWAIEVKSRHGWNRIHEPSYNEFQVDLLTTLRSAWHLKVSYQHLEHNQRVAFYIFMRMNRPCAN